jgi:hypothetical protein
VRILSRISLFAVLVAAAALVPGASAVSFPTPLVGTWTRTVSKADIKRAHVPQSESSEVFPGAVYLLIIRKNGNATATLLHGQGQNGQSWTGTIVPAGANRVHIMLPLAFPNTYSWRVTARRLTFTKVSDSDRTIHDREAVFGGAWTRK